MVSLILIYNSEVPKNAREKEKVGEERESYRLNSKKHYTVNQERTVPSLDDRKYYSYLGY